MSRKTFLAHSSALGLLSFMLVSACSELGVTDTPLTPAREASGTWTTSLPVTFTYHSDFCGPTREAVMQALWHVAFIITPVSGSENNVKVEMRYNAGSPARLNSSCGSGGTGYVPLVSPQFLDGQVSSSSIRIWNADLEFTGSFTTDLMEGTWDHWECIVYCFGETTGTNQLKLMKQK